MDIMGLKYFIKAANYLNFTKAAKECFITQTAMSLHIAKIEDELNFKLFYRNNRSVSLTPGGKVFLQEAEKIIQYYEEGVQHGLSASSGYEGMLRITYSNYLERMFLPEVLRKFKMEFPKIDVKIKKTEQWFMMDKIKSGECDIGMLVPYDVLIQENITVCNMAKSEIKIVVNKDHPLAGYDSIDMEMIQNEKLVLVDTEFQPHLHRRMIRDFVKKGFQPGLFESTDSLDSVLLLVEAGYGAALLPEYLEQVNFPNLKFLKLNKNDMFLEMAVSYLNDNKNPALKLFLDVLFSGKNLPSK